MVARIPRSLSEGSAKIVISLRDIKMEINVGQISVIHRKFYSLMGFATSVHQDLDQTKLREHALRYAWVDMSEIPKTWISVPNVQIIKELKRVKYVVLINASPTKLLISMDSASPVERVVHQTRRVRDTVSLSRLLLNVRVDLSRI